MTAILLLEDGTIFRGKSFGAKGIRCGEVVFNTSMSGYQEILTDPSYHEQIVTMTYPMIGNYGTNSLDWESRKLFCAGFIVKENCPYPSNFRNQDSLSEYLKENDVVGLEGIDTRKNVTAKRGYKWKKGVVDVIKDEELLPKTNYKVIAYDFGIKKNILRLLRSHGCDVEVVPAKTPAEKVLAKKPDGVFLSNGPGDPAPVTYAAENVKKLVGKVPIFGICLGHQ
ncbi:MAG: carbamoyl-phosphate synthase small subunit, partial [Planctomycetota bacterium]